MKKTCFRFANHEESILSASHLGHPDYALSILFPILAAFDTKLAGEVFFSGVVADWINAILKWYFYYPCRIFF